MASIAPVSAGPLPRPRWRRVTGAGAAWRLPFRRRCRSAEEAQAAAEGLTLAAHYSGIYKSDADAKPVTIEALIAIPEQTPAAVAEAAERAAARGYILAACSNLARALANEPANVMTPRTFAEIAVQVAAESGLKADVLDEERLAGLNMGLLLGVARGSAERPRMVVLRYEPARPATRAVLGLVGKGVTFDTGGISIKPSDKMHLMKSDMSGGAAVLAAMKAIAALKPDVAVVGVVPLVENMPGGRAMRPGDVVRSAEGKTVEVLDTDAEGRLILADALVVRAPARRDAPRGCGDADRRDRHRARPEHDGAVRHARRMGRARWTDGQPGGRSRLGAAAVRRLPRTVAQRHRRPGQHRRPAGRMRLRRRCS